MLPVGIKRKPPGKTILNRSESGRDHRVRKAARKVAERQRGRRVEKENSPVEDFPMRGFVLWLLGVPFSVIVLLYLFNVL